MSSSVFFLGVSPKKSSSAGNSDVVFRFFKPLSAGWLSLWDCCAKVVPARSKANASAMNHFYLQKSFVASKKLGPKFKIQIMTATNFVDKESPKPKQPNRVLEGGCGLLSGTVMGSDGSTTCVSIKD